MLKYFSITILLFYLVFLPSIKFRWPESTKPNKACLFLTHFREAFQLAYKNIHDGFRFPPTTTCYYNCITHLQSFRYFYPRKKILMEFDSVIVSCANKYVAYSRLVCRDGSLLRRENRQQTQYFIQSTIVWRMMLRDCVKGASLRKSEIFGSF